MARVNVVYHHFPHYRAPVMRALATAGKHQYEFWGDTREVAGIKPFKGDEVVAIHPLEYDLKAGQPGGRIRGYWRAIADPDIRAVIIIGNPNIHSTWPMAILARFLGKRVLFWAHGWLRPESKAKSWIRNLYYSLADRVLVYGNRATALAAQSGYPAARVKVIYNSLDWDKSKAIDDGLALEDRDELRTSLDLPVEGPVLICTARITPLCRFDLLVEAMALLRDAGRPVTAILVGDGSSRPEIEALAVARGVDVRFPGAVYDEATLARMYHCSDLTVSPGKVGLTAMHSLTYGVPVITHGNLDEQMPEVEVIVEGQTGGFFRQGDAKDLSRAIGAWLDRSLDTAAVGTACREAIAARYTPRRQVDLIDAAVSEIIDGR